MVAVITKICLLCARYYSRHLAYIIKYFNLDNNFMRWALLHLHFRHEEAKAKSN